MSEHVEAFREWVGSIREDVEILEAIINSEAIEKDARQFAAAALNYVVTRMDLVPDWEESIGVLDDVTVTRICTELASQRGLDEGLSDAKHIVAVGRLVNESKRIDEFLGDELAADLRKYVARLVDTSARGRGVATILENPEERAKLYEEVADDIRRMPAAPFEGPDTLTPKFKSYLQYKLTKYSDSRSCLW
ncbi:MAG: hypothetical protein GY811_13365 [Myxococcales bacterium]|nr:hypothetical protein [Myxococcales bacterium]